VRHPLYERGKVLKNIYCAYRLGVARVLLYIWIGIAFVIAVVVSLFIDYSASPVYARSADFHVVIDAGHGGRDVGASGPSGVSERDINLAIAKYLGEQLRASGAGVTMTRTSEHSLANPYAKNQKKSDMDERRKIIEKVKPDLVVSIHLNTLAGHPGVRGAQVFFAKDSEPSKRFATAVQTAFNQSNLDTSRNAAAGSFYMLECTQYPSVLVECGFLSNPGEEKLLGSKPYQKLLAYYIAQGINSVRY